MAFTTPKTYAAGDQMIAPDMNTYQRDNIDDLDARLRYGFRMKDADLSNDTVGATGQWEDWGTETIGFVAPLVGEVSIIAFVTGFQNNVNNVSSLIAGARVGINPGTGYTFGGETNDGMENDAVVIDNSSCFACHVVKNVSPTTDRITIKAQIFQDTDAAGDCEWKEGNISGMLIPTGT